VNEESNGAEIWTEAASERLYKDALREGAAIANRSVSTKFEEGPRKTWEEYTEFIGRVGRGLSVDNASDLDIIAVVQGVWIRTYVDKCRTRTEADGEKVSSTSAGKGVIQHLAKSYIFLLGYADGDNPAKQESVKSYCEGYRVILKEKGVREKRAKVFKEEKVTAFVEYLENGIERSNRITKCILLMDLATVDYLWETWARGKECGELRADQIDLETGIASPRWSKTMQSEPSARIDLTEGRRGRFIRSAANLLAEMERQGYAGGHDYLFRPLKRNWNGFEDSALSSNALRRRIQQHLKDASMYDGETLHSFRRSAVQNAAAFKGRGDKTYLSL
jgi:hypothetical protein